MKNITQFGKKKNILIPNKNGDFKVAEGIINKDQLLSLTLRQLRQEASKLSVPLYSRKTKAVLVDLILKYQEKSSKKIYDEHGRFDLVIARHMFAHNAFPIDLLENIDKLVKDDGIIFIENAYAISTFENGEFDQIYHEHMFYYSVLSFENILKKLIQAMKS